MRIGSFVSLVFLAFIISACSSNPAKKPARSVIVPSAYQQEYEQLKFAPAMRAGDMVYLSGVVVQVGEGEANDIRPAIVRAFDEISVILAEAGLDWTDVVDVTSYLTDLENQLGPLWQVKEERVPPPYPAWSAIGVSQLYGGESALIEIKVTAYDP